MLDAGAVALIEWGDVVEPVLPADFLEVRITYDADTDDARHFTLRPVGSSWANRSGGLQKALDRWVVS